MKENIFIFFLIEKFLKSFLTVRSYILLKFIFEQNIGLQRTFNNTEDINDTITHYTIS